MKRLLWLDIETTGLDPTVDLVLEVAVVVTDFEASLTPLLMYHAVVRQPLEEVEVRLNDVVRNMHTTSGLLSELPAATRTPVEVAQDLLEIGTRYKGAFLAGASVHFDRSFMDVFAPAFTRTLSHRHFDSSTLRAAATLAGCDALAVGEAAHRAMPDILGSLGQSRQVVDWLRK